MVRLALVGCGRNASTLASAISASDRCELTIAVDLDPVSAGHIAELNGARAHTGNLESLLASDAADIDAVVVNTPNDKHVHDASTAIAAGKHVLVEKPLALSAKEASVVVQEAETAQVCLMVAHTLRFMPPNVQVQRAVKDGELGRPGMLRSHRWLRRFPGPPAGWKHNPGRSGGLAIHEGVHEIDQAIWLIGERPTHVHGSAQPNILHIHLGFETGAMALCDIAVGLPLGEGYYSLLLVGSAGAAYIDDQHNLQLVYRGGRPEAFVNNQRQLGVRAQFDEFGTAIHEQRKPTSAGPDAVLVLQIAEAVQASIDSGQTAKITESGYVLT